MSWTAESLEKRLREFHSSEYAWSELERFVVAYNRKAAVLVPLVIKAGVLHVWLTRRCKTLRRFSGDVAFPGGMQDKTDPDLLHAALRESQEEIQLHKDQVQIFCPTIPRVLIENEVVLPYIGLVAEDFSPVLNLAEVDAAFTLPLEQFLSGEGVQTITYTDHDFTYVLPTYKHTADGQTYKIRGLTAVTCLDLAIMLFQRAPEFNWDVTGLSSVHDPYGLQKKYVQARLAALDDIKSKM